MRKNKYLFYLKCFQNHPSIAYTDKIINDISYIKELLPLGKTLCVGCADGYEVKMLNDLGYECKGITLGKNNVKYGKEKYDIDIRTMGMGDIQFECESFDNVYSSHSFEHCLLPIIHICEIWSILKENGLWFIVYPKSDLNGKDSQIISHHHPNVLLCEEHKKMFTCFGFNIIESWEQNGRNELEQCFLLQKDRSLSNVHSDVKSCLEKRVQIKNFQWD